MEDNLSISYRGFNIQHQESGGIDKFTIIGDNNWRNNYPTLNKIMEHIDRLLKTKFEKVDVILPRWGHGRDTGEISEGTATSITEDGSVWVSFKGKVGYYSRSKMSSGVYLDTPENRETVNTIFGILEKKTEYNERIEQQIKALKMQMSSPIPTEKRKECGE